MDVFSLHPDDNDSRVQRASISTPPPTPVNSRSLDSFVSAAVTDPGDDASDVDTDATGLLSDIEKGEDQVVEKDDEEDDVDSEDDIFAAGPRTPLVVPRDPPEVHISPLNIITELDKELEHDRMLASNKPGCIEWISILALRIRGTRICLFVYVVLVVLNLFLLIYEGVAGESHWIEIFVECVINFLLILEVSVGLITEGRDFFKSWINRFDLGITIFCVAFFIFFITEIDLENLDEKSNLPYIDSVILIIRYGVQLGRLSFLACRGRRTTTFMSQEEVTFITPETPVHRIAANARLTADDEKKSLIGPSGSSGPKQGRSMSNTSLPSASSQQADHLQSLNFEDLRQESAATRTQIQGND